MKTEVFEGLIIAKSPIVHSGDEKTGMEVLLKRIKFKTPRGIIEIPCISGNSVRGRMRRLLAKHLLDSVGYQPKSPMLFHSLFSGGVLEEVEADEVGKIDLNIRKEIRSLIPFLSLMGTAYGNQVLQGKLNVGIALPICRELTEAGYIPNKFVTQKPPSIFELLDFDFATRRDEREAPQKEESKVTVQMLYRFEVFIPGTSFYHNFKLLDATELEKGAFFQGLRLWLADPNLGGRRASGYGDLELKYSLPEDFNALADAYVKFLQESRSKIVSLLSRMDEGK